MAITQLKTNYDFCKQEFISVISHELKTPLSSVIGFLDVLRDEICSIEKESGIESDYDSKQKSQISNCLKYISEINQAAIDMNELIHDLLDVGQVASGRFSVDLSNNVEVKDFIMRSVRLNQDYAIKRGISLKVEIAEGIDYIHLDSKRMKQVLTNLLSNAIKYSNRGSEVRVICKNISPHPLYKGLKSDPEFLEISVIDQGFGMNQSQIQVAFQKYKTASNHNSTTIDSFGLGLPIAKHLIEMQKGILEVESEPNQGTKMIMKFPYADEQ